MSDREREIVYPPQIVGCEGWKDFHRRASIGVKLSYPLMIDWFLYAMVRPFIHLGHTLLCHYCIRYTLLREPSLLFGHIEEAAFNIALMPHYILLSCSTCVRAVTGIHFFFFVVSPSSMYECLCVWWAAWMYIHLWEFKSILFMSHNKSSMYTTIVEHSKCNTIMSFDSIREWWW